MSQDYCPHCFSTDYNTASMSEFGTRYDKHRCNECTKTWTTPA